MASLSPYQYHHVTHLQEDGGGEPSTPAVVYGTDHLTMLDLEDAVNWVGADPMSLLKQHLRGNLGKVLECLTELALAVLH